MANSSSTGVSSAVPGAPPVQILHTRLAFLTSLHGSYGDQELFFSAVNNGDNRARAALVGSEGVRTLREWMELCRVELVCSFFFHFFQVYTDLCS